MNDNFKIEGYVDITRPGMKNYIENKGKDPCYSIETALFDIQQELRLIISSYNQMFHEARNDLIHSELNDIIERVITPICKSEEDWLKQILKLKQENEILGKNLRAALGERKNVLAIIIIDNVYYQVQKTMFFGSVKDAVEFFNKYKDDNTSYELYYVSSKISQDELNKYLQLTQKEHNSSSV